MKRFSSLSIKARVVLLATLPVVMLTLLLSGYMISTKLQQERNTLIESSQSILRYLAVGAEFGLFSNNISSLSSISQAALKQRDIEDVLFIDRRGGVVYQGGQTEIAHIPYHSIEDPVFEPIYLSAERWSIQAPVLIAGIQVDDFNDEEETLQSPRQIGWVILVVNEQEMIARQQNIILQGLLITLLGLLVTIWIAMSIGKSITQPIQSITLTIEKLRQEKLNARVDVDSHGELGELQEGINNLATRVQDTRLRLEEEVEDATQNLRTALNTLERKNSDLDFAKQKAEAANHAKDQFLARMSHELRTPLTSVIGFSQLLQKTPLDNQQQEYSSIVQKTSSLLLSLIDDVLDFSKLQTDAVKLESIAFSLDECLTDVLEMQSPIAAAKDINLYYTPAASLPPALLGDPTRVRQIITNLVGNAIKFTEEGSVSISVSCTTQEDQADITINISDTGIGISPSQIAQLFEPFTQADTTITRRFGGSGLGLVISKHFAQLMNGSLVLESTPNIGTCASVQLPMVITEVQSPPLLCPDCNILVLEHSPMKTASFYAWVDYFQASYTRVDSPKALLSELLKKNPLDVLAINLCPSASSDYYRQLMTLVRRYFSGPILLMSNTNAVDNMPLSTQPYRAIQPIKTIRHPINSKKLVAAMNQPFTVHHAVMQNDPQSSSTDNQLAGINVLVAEDNAFNRLLLERFLSYAGAKVTLAPNGERALALARQTRFDCILMDVHMPQMDGIEASRQIKSLQPPIGETPIIALTANVIDNEAKALKAVGIETILFKPINEAQIIDEIQKATGTLISSNDASIAKKKPRLADYGISELELMHELSTQIEAIHRGFRQRQSLIMRDHSHQLTGLAGLLDLVILEAAASQFNKAVKTEDWKEIWYRLWHLDRVIKHLDLTED